MYEQNIIVKNVVATMGISLMMDRNLQVKDIATMEFALFLKGNS
jgi:hypothetical protein